MSVISLKNLSKHFGKTKALDGVNLELQKDEILGFIGPNGAGKTTAIRVILGIIKGEGSAQVFDMDSWKDAVDIHKNLSYVPGDVNLWPNLTGGEVIDLFLKLKGQHNATRKDELVKKFDLDLSKKCQTYSKGNRQKVALIAALASDVDLYIFDEPTSGLDPLMESVFQEEVKQIKAQGKSVLLSSHILSEVEKLCDSISIIKDGRIIESGNLEEMRHLTRSNIKVRTEKPVPKMDSHPLVHDYRVEDDLMIFSVNGDDLGEAMTYLSDYHIVTLESQPPTLEELFMSHYEKSDRS